MPRWNPDRQSSVLLELNNHPNCHFRQVASAAGGQVVHPEIRRFVRQPAILQPNRERLPDLAIGSHPVQNCQWVALRNREPCFESVDISLARTEPQLAAAAENKYFRLLGLYRTEKICAGDFSYSCLDPVCIGRHRVHLRVVSVPDIECERMQMI